MASKKITTGAPQERELYEECHTDTEIERIVDTFCANNLTTRNLRVVRKGADGSDELVVEVTASK